MGAAEEVPLVVAKETVTAGDAVALELWVSVGDVATSGDAAASVPSVTYRGVSVGGEAGKEPSGAEDAVGERQRTALPGHLGMLRWRQLSRW